jgi:hypothetical protein
MAAKGEAAKGGSLNWLMGMICGAAMAFATPAAVLTGVLLAPAILVAVFDTLPRRPVARVVFLAGAGFTLGPVWHLYTAGPTLALALDMLADPGVLCPAWLAGACGWAVCEFLPIALRQVADRQAAVRIAALMEEAEALRGAWDFEGE